MEMYRKFEFFVHTKFLRGQNVFKLGDFWQLHSYTIMHAFHTGTVGNITDMINGNVLKI